MIRMASEEWNSRPGYDSVQQGGSGFEMRMCEESVSEQVQSHVGKVKLELFIRTPATNIGNGLLLDSLLILVPYFCQSCNILSLIVPFLLVLTSYYII